MKVVEFTKIRLTPFKGGILRTPSGISSSEDIQTSTFVKLRN
jgi:hypothetical protein